MNDLTNKRFFRLRVIGRAKKKGSHLMWKCVCLCGKTKSVRGSHLKDGLIVSCGCYQREQSRLRNTIHGECYSPEWKSWSQMHSRCSNPNNADYKNYGGRGIKVCKRWAEFAPFLKDMKRRPSLGHTLERIKNHLGYFPKNCRWATKLEQARNKRTNRFVTVGEFTRCLGEWAQVSGISPSVIGNRLRAGWDEKVAVTKAVA